MSLALFLVCRQSRNLTQLTTIRSSLLRPFNLSHKITSVEASTLKSKYGSMKPSGPRLQNPFQEPTDEKSRRLKMQENIRFRERFQLENDYELVYCMPRQRMYSLMHLLCTCACVSMFAFVVIHFHREMLDIEPAVDDLSKDIPQWILYSMASIIGTGFGVVLILISRMPIRLYYSPVRRSYALFYHPIIGILRQKKISFRDDQYIVIPQKLDTIETDQRTVKVRMNFGDGIVRIKKSFYLIETYFRSRRDILRIRMKDVEKDETINKNKANQEPSTQEESDIWETVVDHKDQQNDSQKMPKRRTLM